MVINLLQRVCIICKQIRHITQYTIPQIPNEQIQIIRLSVTFFTEILTYLIQYI